MNTSSEFGEIRELLSSWSCLMHKLAERTLNLLQDSELNALCRSHEANKRYHSDMGFNVFEIISDTFYRENFHSDVLAAFLDMNGKHRKGAIFLHKFVELINRKCQLVLSPNDFCNYETHRESGRVDILILDHDSRNAIIIENKINGALDQERQVPRYLDYVTDLGYTTVAIVYLSIDGQKEPNHNGWQEDDIARVTTLLVRLAGFDGSDSDLLMGWIRLCESDSSSSDVGLLFRQYGNLIEHLGVASMNIPIMRDFYSILNEGSNFETALSIKELVENIPNYLAILFKERLLGEYSPFRTSNIHKGICAYADGFRFGEAKCAIDVWCSLEQISIQFFD